MGVASTAETSDESLLERFVTGDERAFTQLYRRHARYLAGVARRLMGDELELDELEPPPICALRFWAVASFAAASAASTVSAHAGNPARVPYLRKSWIVAS